MQDDIFRMTNFLIDQKVFHVGSLISTQLNHFSHIGIFLYGTIATKILFEGFANSFNIQIIRKTGHGRNTFSSISLLDTYMNFFFWWHTALVTGILKGIYSIIKNNERRDEEVYCGYSQRSIIGRDANKQTKLVIVSRQ